jgi:PadR family transcriptional regulator PadR
MNAQFKKGVLEMCVLAMIRGRDYYGYELVEELSHQVDVSEGTIYPILRRLTLYNYFETYLRESNEGPPRKYYRITAQGRAACDSLLGEWQEFVDAIQRILRQSKIQINPQINPQIQGQIKKQIKTEMQPQTLERAEPSHDAKI